MLKLQYFCLLLMSLLLVSCNKDGVIEVEGKPTITLDSETGIYRVKVGNVLTISPQVSNKTNATYTWTIDDKVVSKAPSLTVFYDEPQTVYVTFKVENASGMAQEDIKIEVIDLALPEIVYLEPESGLRTLQNTDLLIAPDYQCDDEFTCQWLRDGKVVGTDKSYVFNESQLGKYVVTLEATNEDGTSTRDFNIEVVDRLDYILVRFDTPSYYQTTTDRNTIVGRPVYLKPRIENLSNATYSWAVNGVDVAGATSESYVFTPTAVGNYTVSVKASDSQQEFTVEASVNVHCYASADNARAKTAGSSKYAGTVYEFVPAPGQYVNETAMAGYSGDETTHSAAVAYATRRLQNGNFVSLGGFGGYIIVGFDHSIMAGSGDYDFAIKGNSYNTDNGNSNEPGIVWVMQDTNGNGLPDDEWYELKGSETGKNGTLQNYSVTYYRPSGAGQSVHWRDSEGATGTIDYLGEYHPQAYYYPNWITADSYTLRGTRLASRNVLNSTTGYWSTNPFDWGYADNAGSDALSDQRIGFKIANAMYSDGTPISLKYIDFVKVQVANNAKSGWLGEMSTEVFSFEDLSM
jgi:hypothetical protein